MKKEIMSLVPSFLPSSVADVADQWQQKVSKQWKVSKQQWEVALYMMIGCSGLLRSVSTGGSR